LTSGWPRRSRDPIQRQRREKWPTLMTLREEKGAPEKSEKTFMKHHYSLNKKLGQAALATLCREYRTAIKEDHEPEACSRFLENQYWCDILSDELADNAINVYTAEGQRRIDEIIAKEDESDA
jgi:hypothetical protein